MGLGRLGLPTSRLSGVRSNLLSYKPKQEPSKDVPRNALQRKPEEREALVRMTTDLGESERRSMERLYKRLSPSISVKGGDPSPRSRRDTLLRLHPSRCPIRGRLPLLRVSSPTSGPNNSHGVTGGVYKARERIHRGMLIRDY